METIRLKSEEKYQSWTLNYTAEQMISVLGDDHWESIESRRQLAFHDFDRGDFASAVAPLKNSWRKHEKVFGPQNPFTPLRTC
jgi:hypothetical protein